MILLLLACSESFDHPAIREGEAEYDPNTPESTTQDTAAPDIPADTGDDADTGAPDEPADEVCYPGASEDYTACLPLLPHSTAWGADTYPEPYNDSPQYIAPVRFIDLTVADPDLMLAPNFALDEVMQEYKGDYGMYQVHVMEYLQVIRETTGSALYVNSGYRNITYNAGVGGATYSRHMYGDAVDMYSGTASLSELAAICEDLGAGYVSEYESHVHCDWRDDALDEAFFDVVEQSGLVSRPTHTAQVVVSADGWQAPAAGFDEGEPRRVWSAWATDGTLLEVAEGARYWPPEEAAHLTVEIGGQIVVPVPLTEGSGSL